MDIESEATVCVKKEEEVKEDPIKTPNEESTVHSAQSTEQNTDNSNNCEKEEEEIYITLFQKDENLVQLCVKDPPDDDEEETIQMTHREVCDYIRETLVKCIKDPKVNPFLNLNVRLTELQEEFKEKCDEYMKLNKLFDTMLRNQETFLRHNGIIPKEATNSVGVSVDMPLLNTISPMIRPPAPAGSKEKIECIDLTDDSEAARGDSAGPQSNTGKHPAPLPPRPSPTKDGASHPPKPRLKISAEERGIVLQWDLPSPSAVSTFDIFGYQEQRSAAVLPSLWKKIGSVRAMNLPMACTLTQFVEGHRYHFAIRGVDAHGRCGPYSDPISIVYRHSNPAPATTAAP